jgi:hypothetical protein
MLTLMKYRLYLIMFVIDRRRIEGLIMGFLPRLYRKLIDRKQCIRIKL